MPNDQKFYQAEADALFPQGCKCGNNGGGDCDWCGVYYYGPEHEGYDEGDVKRAFMRQDRAGHVLGCICADCSGAELTADND